MSFKFGLNVKNKNPSASSKLNKPALNKKKPLFDNDEGVTNVKVKVIGGAEAIDEFNFDDTIDAAPKEERTAQKQKSKPTGPPTRKPLPKEDDPTTFANSASAQEAEKRANDALEVDATIYDYDAAYDAVHARTAAKKAAEQDDALQRKPKYMVNLFESAELRKKDQLRARDKLLQREREAEGDEFAEKDKFVTGAYKAQQEEARKAEAEENKRQDAEEEKRRKFGMQGFHKQMLMAEDKRHQEAMEAAAQVAKEGVKIVVEEPKERTDTEVARDLLQQGKTVILNEEGQVADKRQLLSAGLNIVAKPKKPTTAGTTSTRITTPSFGLPIKNSSRGDRRERHTQMVAEQIELAAKRKADEEAEEQSKLQHASKSQKTEGEISNAKERYLQRKREAAAAKSTLTG